MKAVIINSYGPIDVLEHTTRQPVPMVGPRDVLIRNRATSVNPIDVMKRGGYGRPVFEKKRKVRFPWILGNDTAGIVEKIGKKVRRFKVGDEVFSAPGLRGQGTWAEYTAVNEKEAAFKPKHLSFEQAASIPYVAMTSWKALVHHAGITRSGAPGKKVLVHAGSGGVGTFSIQLLKAWGCHVATTCSSRNVELVRELGADTVVDYTAADFERVLKDYDVVFDTLGYKVPGNEEKSLSILRRNSRAAYVSIVHPMLPLITKHGLAAGLPRMGLTLMHRKFKHRGIRYHWSVFSPNGKVLEEVRQLVETGKIKPVIDRVYPLELMGEANAYVETGRASGKVVVSVDTGYGFSG